MVADFRVQTKNNDKSVTRHFLARNGQCAWQFLKYFVSNQLGKTNTKLSTSVQDLNVCTRMKSAILNHYTIVNIYCYKMSLHFHPYIYFCVNMSTLMKIVQNVIE